MNLTSVYVVYLQKARLARIRMAKNASGNAFINRKKKMEERMLARESGLDIDLELKDEDVFNMQHHHLLTCLEKTTVRVWDVMFVLVTRVTSWQPS